MVMLIGPKKRPEKVAVPHHQDKQGPGPAAAPATPGAAVAKAPKPVAAAKEAKPALAAAAPVTATRPGN